MSAVASLAKAFLWILSVALTLFVAVMSVSPDAAAANVTKWLALIGQPTASTWFSAHARHRVHLSTDQISSSFKTPCAAPCAQGAHAPYWDVPDIVLMALGALVVAVVLIWFVSRRRVSLLRPMT